MKRKRWGEGELLSLQNDHGKLTVVPKAWTSLAEPRPNREHFLDGQKMLEMIELIGAIEERWKKVVAK